MATSVTPGGLALRRVAAGAAALAIVIGVTSSIQFLAAYRFDFQALLVDPGSIVGGGPSTAALFHWGAIGDMLYSYLLLAPVALYLHDRLRPRLPWLADLGAVGAFGYIFIGAAGAGMLAAAGPPLIDAYAAAAGPDRLAIASTFNLLTTAVFLGLWQTVEVIPLGLWIVSVGWVIRREHRALGRFLVVAGVGLFAASLRTVLGVYSLSVLVTGVAFVILVWGGWMVTGRMGKSASS